MTDLRIRYLAVAACPLLIACAPQTSDEPAGVASSGLANAAMDIWSRYPYVATVSGVSGTDTCSGTLIGPQHVLTAAHCFCTSTSVDDGNFATVCQPRDKFGVTFRSSGRLKQMRGTACVHPGYRYEEDAEHQGVKKSADLAVIALDGTAPRWASPDSISIGVEPPQVPEKLTMVGYGYSSCDYSIGNGIRRFGTGIVSGIDFLNFPDLFLIHKSNEDTESAVVRPGDSGGPALRINGAEVMIEGVASSSTCERGPFLRPRMIKGDSYYTRLDVLDDKVTHQTYHDWISDWLSGRIVEVCDNGIDDDCNGSADCADTACASKPPCCGHVGERCCASASCVGQDSACDAATDQCVVKPPVPTEVCNFKDDNGDGQVDEGFDWGASVWQTVVSTDTYAVYPRAIGLRDGRVAIAGVDSYGGGFDRGFLVVVSEAGQAVAPPVWTPIGNSGGEYTSIAENPNGEIAALYSSTNYAGCKAGCPAYLTRVRTSDLEIISTSQVSYSFAPYRAFDLAWTPNGYVTLVRATNLTTHVSWLDASGAGAIVDRELPGTGMNAGSLAVSGNGVAWIRSLSGNPGIVDLGMLAPDGSSQILGPTTVATGAVELMGFRNIAWVGPHLVATWVQTPAQSPRIPMAAAVAVDGSVTMGPVAIEANGYLPNDLATVDDNVAVLAVDDSGAIMLQRLGANLTPVAGPNGPLQFPDLTSYSSIARTPSGLMLVHGYTNSLQHEIRVAAVRCQ